MAAAPKPTTWTEMVEGLQVARQERSDIIRETEAIVKDCVSCLRTEGCEGWQRPFLLPSGSAFEGLKVDRADEFDFMVISQLPQLSLPFHHSDAFIGEMGAEKFLTDFCKGVGDKMKQSVNGRRSGPGFKLSIHKTGAKLCDVDLVPARLVKIGDLSPVWRDRMQQHRLEAARLFAVAKVNPRTGKFGWRLSFSEFEKTHIDSLESDGSSSKKLSLRSVKYLTQGKRPAALKSYLLKNMWLDFVEKNSDRSWATDKHTQKQIVIDLINHMLNMLGDSGGHATQFPYIPLFFAPTINLWKPGDDAPRAIECLKEALKVVKTL